MWRFGKSEKRSIENPEIPISSNEVLKYFGLDEMTTTPVAVNERTALSIPAVWAAVNFLASTIADLPLNVYKRTEAGREKQDNALQRVLHDAASDEQSSFDWRKYFMERVLLGGRGLTYIERNTAGRVINLLPLDPNKVEIQRKNFRKTYHFERSDGRKVPYEARDIIDIPYMLEADGLTAISPVRRCAESLGLVIASTKYGSKFFNNGGVPPFVIQGKFESGKALQRARDDVTRAIKEQTIKNGNTLALPMHHELKSIGVDPEKSQLTDVKRFGVEEVARIYQLPPTFLQDLTHGTFSNTEQQDLHLVKHTLRRWVVQIEQELNLKLFGRSRNTLYCEFNLDGLLRGDFTSRMEGYSTAIQNAILTPNEVRESENRPRQETGDADLLHIQGATVPLGKQPASTDGNPPATQEPPGDE